MRYSVWALARNALSGHRAWPMAWKNPAPKKHYDVVIIGGGVIGLSWAWVLAQRHGLALGVIDPLGTEQGAGGYQAMMRGVASAVRACGP